MAGVEEEEGEEEGSTASLRVVKGEES